MDEPASAQQRRYFFALVKSLRYAPELAKQKAKAKYGVESFMDLSKFQMQKLIDALLEVKEKRGL